MHCHIICNVASCVVLSSDGERYLFLGMPIWYYTVARKVHVQYEK